MRRLKELIPKQVGEALTLTQSASSVGKVFAIYQPAEPSLINAESNLLQFGMKLLKSEFSVEVHDD